MQHQTSYLTPGFFITLYDQRQSIHFTQFPGQLRRASPFRLALVDAFNQGYQGKLEDLIEEIARRYDAPVPGVERFVNKLDEFGFLVDAAPESYFSGETTATQAPAGSGPLTIITPVTLVTELGRYHWYDHQGKKLLSLNMAEVKAVSIFAEPISVEEARRLYLAQEDADGLDQAGFDALVARMAGANLLVEPPSALQDNDTPAVFRTVDRDRVQALVDARVAAHDEKMASSGKDLIQVLPVNSEKGMAPASLGLLMAYAMEYEGGRLNDKYDFVPMFLTDEDRLVQRATTPGIYLFSNYVWNEETNLKLSAAVKAVNPENITVHGGPSTPSYEKDCEQFFIDNPHVDIAARGEGELTFAVLLDKLDLANSTGLDVLQDVEGLTFRKFDGVHRTGNRDRIADLNSIPSPYLMGLFDEFGSVSAGAVIETNRGCPYGCTFCDWGSATLSKVRKFDLERVYKELEWSAVHQIEGASIADANFGMLRRDVEITEKIADLKRAHGFPRSVAINYAKNQVKYLRQIIEIMADVDILAEGVVSLQTTDEHTLEVIDRSNIKLDKYNELSTEFRRARLPLAADIMMGLPGSTTGSFRKDLQRCTDRDIRVRANPTQLLPNSPMNEPGYRKEHGIVARPGEFVKEAASYSREEWDEMDSLRLAYYLLDSYGVLRYVARYVRRETGMGEVELYDKLRSEALRNSQEWPVISTTLKYLEGYMAPPGSWGLFIEEIRRYLVTRLGMSDDSGLKTTLAVQLAHLPAPGRTFPEILNLEHDYAAWQAALLSSREDDHRDDWENHTPRLSEFGPATLTIDDPNEVCSRDIGKHRTVLDFNIRTWELQSPVARPRLGVV